MFFIKKKTIKKIYRKKIKTKLSKKKEKKLYQKKKYSFKEKVIISLFLSKYLQVYYAYLQTLCKLLVIFDSSHVLPYCDIPWS